MSRAWPAIDPLLARNSATPSQLPADITGADIWGRYSDDEQLYLQTYDSLVAMEMLPSGFVGRRALKPESRVQGLEGHCAKWMLGAAIGHSVDA